MGLYLTFIVANIKINNFFVNKSLIYFNIKRSFKVKGSSVFDSRK